MPTRCIFVLVLLMMAALSPLAARAAESDIKDVAVISRCMDQVDKVAGTQEADEACLMKIALQCMKGDEVNISSADKINCLDREQSAWDKILNDSYKVMMTKLEPEQQTKLREMQQSWIHTRDLTCTFWFDYFQGTMANPMIAYCNNRETARRAIYLRVFATDIADRK
jgi:uncharacterized protein YecT (DUF1311 family)